MVFFFLFDRLKLAAAAQPGQITWSYLRLEVTLKRVGNGTGVTARTRRYISITKSSRFSAINPDAYITVFSLCCGGYTKDNAFAGSRSVLLGDSRAWHLVLLHDLVVVVVGVGDGLGNQRHELR